MYKKHEYVDYIQEAYSEIIAVFDACKLCICKGTIVCRIQIYVHKLEDEKLYCFCCLLIFAFKAKT